jgi:hypothetical protein
MGNLQPGMALSENPQHRATLLSMASSCDILFGLDFVYSPYSQRVRSVTADNFAAKYRVPTSWTVERIGNGSIVRKRESH